MILTITATIAGLLIVALAWLHGLRAGIQRGVTYSSDRHAGYTEGLAVGRRESRAERDELVTRIVRVRQDLAEISRIDHAYDDAIAMNCGGGA